MDTYSLLEPSAIKGTQNKNEQKPAKGGENSAANVKGQGRVGGLTNYVSKSGLILEY